MKLQGVSVGKPERLCRVWRRHVPLGAECDVRYVSPNGSLYFPDGSGVKKCSFTWAKPYLSSVLLVW